MRLFFKHVLWHDCFCSPPLSLLGGTNASKVQLLPKPMYCPSGLLTMIWWRISMSYWQHCTGWDNPPVSPAEFPISPKNKLSVRCFSKAFDRKIEFMRSYVAASLYTNFQHISVEANIVENLETCDAVHPSAKIFLITGHRPTNSTPAPLWRTVVAWAWGRWWWCIFFIQQLLGEVQTPSPHCQNIPEEALDVLSCKCWQKFLNQKEYYKNYI